MSARDSASGSSTYKGGSGGAGGLGNGGVGGGMSSGSRGGGAGYNGGAGSRTGMTTGTTTYGNTAFGRPGGNAVAYGMRDAASLGRAGMGPTVGSFGNFRTPSGAAMFGNSPVQGQSFYGMNMGQALSQANRAQQAWQAANRPQVGGLLDGAPTPASAAPYDENVLAVEDVPAVPNPNDPMAMYTTLTPPKAPSTQGWLPSWHGTGQWWGDKPRYMNNSGLNPAAPPGPTRTTDDYKTGYGDPQYKWGRSPDGSRYDGPGNTVSRNGNTVSQNNVGAGSVNYGTTGSQGAYGNGFGR